MEQRRKLLSGFVRHPGFWTTACLTLLTSLLFQFGAFAATAPNNIISYQGRVLDAGGVPLGDATATMIFRLYDAVSGGSCLWSNSSATCASATGRTVTLTDGLFSENLGDTNAGTPYAAIADTVFADNAAVYLSISVNGELLTPRKLLTAAPYALNAQALDGLSSSGFLQTSMTGATTVTFGGSTYALTFTNNGSGNEVHNLSSTGDLVIQDNGTPIATFADTGAITFAGTSGQAMTFGTTAANLILQTTTSGDITATTGAASGLLNVLTGNLKVGNGTPGVTLDGEDAYIEGTLEVDGSVQFDGTATVSDLVCTDCLNFSDLGDALTLDASTSIGFGGGALALTFTNDGSGNEVHNLSSTGDLQIKDNGTAFFTFSDNGTTTQTLSTADTLSANTLTVTTTGLGATEAAFGHTINLNADSSDNQGAQFAGTAVQFTDGASDLNQQGLFVYGSNDYNGSWGLSGAPLTQDGAYKGVQVILEGAPGSNNQGRIIGAEIGLTNSGSNYVNELMGVNVDISELASNSSTIYGFSVNNSDTGVDDGPYIGDAGLRVQGGWEYGVDLSGITGSSVALMTGSAPIDLQAATNQDLDISGNGSGNINFNLPSTGDLVVKDNGTAFFTFDDEGNATYEGRGNQQFALTSGLSVVSRDTALFSVTQADGGLSNNNMTGDNALAVITSSDTGSIGDLLYLRSENAGGYILRVDDVSGDTTPFLIDADGNVFLGATAETNSNSGFSMNGDDMFIAGSLGVESSVYTDGSFVAGASTTISNGSISQSSGETLAIGTTSADLTLQTTTSGDIVLSPASDVVLSPAASSGVGIGTASPITALHVPVRIPTSATATITTGASTDVHGVFAQGRYVYFVVEDGASDELRVYDYSVPGSPTQMGTGRAVTSSNDYNLYVQGQYAYVYGGTTLSIFDVSNPSDTSAAVGTVSVNNSSLAYISDLYVAGRYAYVLAGGSDTVQIVDVSNPASPAIVGTINTYNTTSTTPNSIEVKGDYAYIATNNSSTSDDFILVYDVSNPAEATLVDGTPTTTGECDTAMDFTVQGRYGYVACYSAGTFETYDLSDPTAVVQTDVLSTGVSFPWGVFVQGRYAFVGHNASTSVKVIDISDPTTASIVGTITTSGSVVNDLFVNGRYLFTGNDSSTESVNIFDLGGSYIQQFEAGGIEAGALNLRNGLYATDGTFLGGLSVSQSLQVSGGISAGSSALTQITTNTATLNTFDIQAAALVQNTAAGTINWRGTNMLMPNITQTTGTITADGLRIVNGSITTAGTENMINLAAAGVGAGTLRALNIGSITPSSGTETAITVGSGWDTGISLTTGAATTAWNLDATTNDSTLTTGVVDLNIDSATNSNIGFNIDYTSQSGITAASDVFAAVINLTQNDADGDLFGMFVNAAAVSTTQSGTNYYECLLCAENDENSSAAVLAAVWINSTAGTAGSITNGILINTTDVTTDFNMQNAETISNDTNGTVTIAGSSNGALVDFIDAASGSVVADFDGSVRLDLNIAGSSTEAVCSTVGGEGDTNTVLDDCTTTVSADYMEMYPTAADVGIGDILVPGTETVTTQTGSTLRQMVKSSGAYQSNVLGIASNPADAGDFNSIGHNIADEDRPWPVALNGRVPVKVNSENGSIVPGDMITTSSVPGVGMKATEPGMVVGMAIDSWTGPGTGTVMVFVQTGWHAGSAISNDGSMPLFTDSVAFASLGTATAVETGKDSETLSFLGSGWNGTSAEQVGMGIKLAATDATAYRLSFTNKTDTEVAYVTGTGDLVLSGKLYPSDRGTAQTDKYIYYDGSAGPGGDFMRTNASGWSTGSYDFAEMFPSTQGLAPGELVVASSTGEKEHVERSTLSYQKALLGIVSTKPGFLAGDNKEGHFPIALKGRVPTLVTAENGPIAVGDPLTSSSTPGYAMKAVKAGPVVGYALEPFTGSQGSVIAFVSLGWWEPDAVVAPVTATTSGVSNTASQAPIGSTASSLTLEGNLFMTGNSILSVGRIAGIADRWSIEEDGTVKTEGTYKAVITSLQNEKVDTYATLNREQKITLSGTGRLVNGAASIQFEAIDPKFNDITSTTAPVRVLVTLRGPANGVYVALADHNGFDVRELANGTSTVDFDWYAEAYRLGQEPPTMLETPTEPAPTESAPPEPAPVVIDPLPVVTESAPITPEPVVTEPPPVVEPTAPAPTEPVAPEPVVWEPVPTDPVPTP